MLLIYLSTWLTNLGPEGIWATSIASNATGQIFVGGSGNLYKKDGANQWQNIFYATEDRPFNIITSLYYVESSKTLLVGTDIGLYSISDNNSINRLLNGFSVNVIKKIDYLQSSEIMIGTNKGIYVSSDDGKTFSPGYPMFANKNIVDFAFDKGKQKLFIAVYNDGIYFKRHAATLWKMLKTSPLLNYRNIELVKSVDTLFIIVACNGKESRGGLLSLNLTDTTQDWSFILDNVPVNSLSNYNNYLYFGTDYPLGIGKLNLDTREINFQNKGINSFLYNIVYSKHGVVYAGSIEGLYRENNNEWQRIDQGLKNKVITFLKEMGNTIYCGTIEGNLYSSDKNMTFWKKENNSLLSIFTTTGDISNGIISIGCLNSIKVSYDTTKTWDSFYIAQNVTAHDIEIPRFNPDYIFIASDSGLFRLYKNQVNKIYNGKVLNIVTFYNDSLIFISTEDGLYESTNNGENFLKKEDIYNKICNLTSDSKRNYVVLSSGLNESVLKFWDKRTWNDLAYPDIKNQGMFRIMDSVLIVFSNDHNMYLLLDTSFTNSWIDFEKLERNVLFTDNLFESGVFYLSSLSGINKYTNDLSINLYSDSIFSPDFNLIDDNLEAEIYWEGNLTYLNIDIWDSTFNKRIKSFKGTYLDSTFTWDGTDTNGNICTNGHYNIIVTAYDILNNNSSDTVLIKLDKKPFVSDTSCAFSNFNIPAFYKTGKTISMVYTSGDEIMYVSGDSSKIFEPVDISQSIDKVSANPNLFIENLRETDTLVVWIEDDNNIMIYENGNKDTLVYEEDLIEEAVTNYLGIAYICGGNVKFYDYVEENSFYIGKGDFTNILEKDDTTYIFYLTNNTLMLAKYFDKDISYNKYLKSSVKEFYPLYNPTDNNIYLILNSNDKLILTTLDADTILNIVKEISAVSKHSQISYDEHGNVYIVWESNGTINYFVQYQNEENSQIKSLGTGTCPVISQGGKDVSVAYVVPDKKSYKIEIVDISSPGIKLSFEPFLLIGDTLHLHVTYNGALTSILGNIGNKDLNFQYTDSGYISIVNINEDFAGNETLPLQVNAILNGKSYTVDTLVFLGNNENKIIGEDAIFIVPNPCTIDHTNLYLSPTEPCELYIEIYNVKGQKISQEYYENVQIGRNIKFKINTETLGTDIYYLKIIAIGDNKKNVVIKRFGVIR